MPEEIVKKPWYLSKTVWVMVIGGVGGIVQAVTGKELINAEYQLMILSVLGVLLRLITKQSIG